ncbi:MAG: HAD hydrolase-like protein [Opitutales bacterium]|nr:HAD hydrolase-like protein [Opitutales bacterium]
MNGRAETAAQQSGPPVGFAEKLAGIRYIALDLDGTVYCGGTLFPFVPAFLTTLRRLGISYSFLTNNSSTGTEGYVLRLRAMGIAATPQDIRISTHSATEFIRCEWPGVERVFIAGTADLADEFAQAGFNPVESEPDCVVIGFDPRLPFERLCRAGYWIQSGVHYLATHPDLVCPTNEATLLLDCGALAAALRAATGRSPDAVLGKPHPRMLAGVMQARGLKAEEVLVAGDRIYTDVAMARAVGARSVLVLSGETTADEAARALGNGVGADFVFADLAELGDALAAACVNQKTGE